jgi:histidinol dehydrogenase
MTLQVISANDRVKLARAYRSGWMPPPELSASVAAILADVRLRGDAALIDYSRRFDDSAYDIAKLRVAVPMREGARGLVPPEIAEALQLSKERIERFHERQRHADLSYVDEDGTRYGMRYRPLDAIAAYVHGGPVSGASAVLMTAVPAAIAGVSRTIVVSPPGKDGRVDPGVLFACSLCGVDALYAVGGAHAVAAVAYGTESIAPVEMIVGGTNPFVVEAKRQVYGTCAIDGLAGPPEVLVIADDGANSELVAGELLAQAERSPLARVGVISESRSLLEAVAQLLDTLDVRTLVNGETIASVMDRSCYLIHANDRHELLDVTETFAPERVSLQVRDAEPYLARLRRVGAVFVGDATPVCAGDYLAGTNNVLPAAGAARFASGLHLGTFLRSFSVVENSRERTERDVQPLAALAEFEGLPEHAQSARMRSGS